jgi:hypothetical protein
MQKGLTGIVGGDALVLVMATIGCDSSRGGSASGGKGGSSSTGGGLGGAVVPKDCPNETPCGGDVVGTWKVTSSCLSLSGDMDVELASLGCKTVPVTGSLDVSGTWTANGNGTYTDNTTPSSATKAAQGTGCPNEGKDTPANATGEQLSVSGHKVHSLYTKAGQAYWLDGSKLRDLLRRRNRGRLSVRCHRRCRSSDVISAGYGKWVRVRPVGVWRSAIAT